MEIESLLKKVDLNNLPKHVGIIMDGNGRWARSRGLPRIEGHKEGLKALEQILEFNRYLKIPFITIYAFSKENWQRDKEEVDFLMSMALKVIREKIHEFKTKKIKFIHIGDTEGISQELLDMIKLLERETQNGYAYTLCTAFNYSGKHEIMRAVKLILEDYKKGNLQESTIDEETISNYIYHPEVPDLDLIIRTSGEQRISNFMLWRAAYSEFYFTEVLWPDFTPHHLIEAIRDYQSRERRFGRVLTR
ncbi:MAG: polyprenyl diphosphate synthase [Brevinematales bacterium]|nr:polyprenyl diphosphate synthase [Brevinematales bacterium]